MIRTYRVSFMAILVISSLVLVACRTEPTQAPQETTYPAPPQATGPASPYTAPQISFELVPVNPYPVPEGAEEIDWAQVSDLLAAGEAAEVLQTSSLKIVITTKDGRSLFAQQPQANEILKLIESCGANCADIKIKSEF